MKLNLSTMLIALCTTSILTLSACSLGNGNSSGSNKNTAQTNTPKVDLSKYQDQRKMCQKITKKKILDCQQKGGKLKKQGMAQCYSCSINYADGGKTCSDSSECEGACLNYGDFITAGKTNQQGQCAKDNSPFGCYQKIEKGVAKHALCVD